MAYCTGRCMCHEPLRRTYDVEQVTTAVRHVFAERVAFHDGTAEIAPGITLHLVGGHTGGMQILRVPTARGSVVLASDATHFWYNIRKRSPFVILHSLEKMIEGLGALRGARRRAGSHHPGARPGGAAGAFRKFPATTNTVQLHLPPDRD